MQPEPDSPAIRLAGVDFAYGGGRGRDAVDVLRAVTLDADPGTTLGVIGPNGGGKTTLVRLLLGLLTPTAGTVEVCGLPPGKAVARGDLVGYLPQSPRLPEHFPISARQVVHTGLAGKAGLLRRPSKADRDFADDLIARVGAADYADRPANRLSGGQLQRVLIARALAPRPRVLLLDEPTVGIDAAGQRAFLEQLQRLQADLRLTVVFVTHDLRAVTAVADRIACLNRTLHYHDVPQRMPPDLIFRLFACDLQAMGVAADGHAHADPPAAADAAPPVAANAR